MPFCPICSSALRATEAKCPNCGSEFSAQSGVKPIDSLANQAQSLSEFTGIVTAPPAPLLTPALSVALRFVAVCIAVLAFGMAGFFLLGERSPWFALPALVVVPLVVFQRRNLTAIMGVTAIGVLLAVTSCAANFRWAGH